MIELPAEVAAGRVAATLRDGVLELKLPKVAPAKKVIPIKSNVACVVQSGTAVDVHF